VASSGLKHGAPRWVSEGRDRLFCFSGFVSTNPETSFDSEFVSTNSETRISHVNKQLARRISFLAITSARIVSILLFATNHTIAAQPQALEDCVERLARKAVALPHERRMALVWTNHAGLSEEHSEKLRELFAAQLEASQIRVVQGEAAPALRVSIEQTPTKFVLTASVPGEGATSVAIEEVARALVESDKRAANVVRLEKELVWQQETRVLSAALPSFAEGAEKKMVLLTEDAVQVYGEESGEWKLRNSKTLPGPKQPPRAARGHLLIADERPDVVGILFPGRRCEATLGDDAAIVCVAAGAEWPPGRLLANPGCRAQTWWLTSEGTDWTSEDRLLLRSSGAGSGSVPVVEMSMPGAVFSVAAGPNTASAAVVARNLVTGNFEVYRVGLVCAN
jgi:hypothetical protein